MEMNQRRPKIQNTTDTHALAVAPLATEPRLLVVKKNLLHIVSVVFELVHPLTKVTKVLSFTIKKLDCVSFLYYFSEKLLFISTHV